MSIFRKKSLETLLAQSADTSGGLKKTLGAWSLVALGIGAIIGAGLFVRTASASAEAAVFTLVPVDLSAFTEVKGYDFSEGIDFDAMFRSYRTMGFQATNVGKAIEKINEMLGMKH